MVKKSALFFVLAIVALYLMLTYSYAGYRPDFPEETRFRKLTSVSGGYVLQTDSVADRVSNGGTVCGVDV